MRVLSIGECMAELSPAGAADTFRLGFAGDTFNTSWYLARLCPDISVAFYTAVGTDAMSARMRGAVVEAGIEDSFIQTIDDANLGLYLISLDNGERSFSYWRGQSAARRMLCDPSKLTEAVIASDLIYFSGITLAILDAEQRSVLFDTLRTSRGNGKTVIFDPNLRPRLWQSSHEMTDVVMQGAKVSDVVLPSFEDEADWFNDATPEETAKRYSDAGVTTVVVKNGGAPVHFWNAGTTGNIPVKPMKSIVDSTAAGDSFNAEILAGIIEQTPLEESIERACAVASLVVQGRGALVSVSLDLIVR